MIYFRSFIITGLSSTFVTILSFCNGVLIARYFGPEGRGVYSVVTIASMILLLIFGEGVQKCNTIISGKNKKNVGSLFLISLIITLIIAIIFIVIYRYRHVWGVLLPNFSEDLVLLTLAITLFYISWQWLQGLFLGLQNVYYYNLLLVLSVLIALIINIIGVLFFNFAIIDVIYSLLYAAIITFLVGLIGIYKSLAKVNLNSICSELNLVKSIALKSTLAASFSFILFKGNTFIIFNYLGDYALGLFSISLIISEVFQKIPNAAGPMLISKSLGGLSEQSIQNTARIARTIFFINIVFSIFLGVFGRILIVFIFGKEYINSYEVVLLMIPAFIFIGPGAIIYSYFISESYPKHVVFINLIVAALNIILSFEYISKYGVYGAAVINSATYFLWTAAYIVVFKKSTGLNYNEIFIIKKSDFDYLINTIRK